MKAVRDLSHELCTSDIGRDEIFGDLSPLRTFRENLFPLFFLPCINGGAKKKKTSVNAVGQMDNSSQIRLAEGGQKRVTIILCGIILGRIIADTDKWERSRPIDGNLSDLRPKLFIELCLILLRQEVFCSSSILKPNLVLLFEWFQNLIFQILSWTCHHKPIQ